MPSFAGALSDRNIADVANYVRASWADKAPADVTPAMVASLRAVANVGAAGTEASRDFDCPRVGSGSVPGALAGAGAADFLAADDDDYLSQRIRQLVDTTLQQQPGISVAGLVNMMDAAMCPAVAISNLSTAAKRAKLMHLDALVRQQAAAAMPSPGTRVLLSVPLSAGVAQAVTSAAAAQHQTPDAYLADLIAKQAATRK
jgi:hypothetical protein